MTTTIVAPSRQTTIAAVSSRSTLSKGDFDGARLSVGHSIAARVRDDRDRPRTRRRVGAHDRLSWRQRWRRRRRARRGSRAHDKHERTSIKVGGRRDDASRSSSRQPAHTTPRSSSRLKANSTRSRLDRRSLSRPLADSTAQLLQLSIDRSFKVCTMLSAAGSRSAGLATTTSRVATSSRRRRSSFPFERATFADDRRRAASKRRATASVERDAVRTPPTLLVVATRRRRASERRLAIFCSF